MAASSNGRGVVLGYLKYVLGFDSLAFDQGVNDADKRLKAAQKKLAKTADQFKTYGAALSVGVTGPIVAAAAAAVSGFRDQQAAMAQVDTAIKSMGNAAGLSAQQLSDFADQLEMHSLVDADAILKESTANLLTFGNVAGENFKRAQQAALDLSARMGTDLQGATIMVGKALNDPVKGVTALTRVGIQFTAQQKAQIAAMTESGNVAGAQAIILKELERQYAGSAQAAANTDPWRQVSVKLGQVGDAIGEKLLPLIPPLADALMSVLDAFSGLTPETQKWLVITVGIAAALGPVLVAIGGLVSGFGALLPLVGPIVTGIGALSSIIISGAIPAITSMIVALGPVLVPIAAVTAAIAGVVLAVRNWDKISAFAQRLYEGIKTWLMDKLGKVWDWLKGKITAVGDWFYNLWDRVVGHSYIPDMVDEIGVQIAKLQNNMVKPIAAATGKAAEEFQQLQGDVSTILERLFPDEAARVKLEREMATLSKGLAEGAIQPEHWKAARARLIDEMNNLDMAIAAKAKGTLVTDYGTSGPIDLSGIFAKSEEALQRFADKAVAVKDTASDAFADLANNALNSLSNLASAIKSGGVLDIISSAFNAFGSIAKTGVLGQKLATGFKDFGGISGFRANGGPVTAGKSYVVGERRAELFTPSRSGYIHPTTDMPGRSGGAATVQIVPSPYFDVRVDNRAAAVAAPMAASAAQGGAAGAQKAVMLRGSRSLNR